MPPPTTGTDYFATDEDVVNLAGADYQVIASRWFKFAAGLDGVFASGTPWVLTSASVNFQTQGVQANMVCQLLKPSNVFSGSGDLLAVESCTGNSLTLRRVMQPVGIGSPPGPAAGVTGVQFLITSLQQQIEDVTYNLEQRFAIDDTIPLRTKSDITDLRIFRRMTVFALLRSQYENMNRETKGDFSDKVAVYKNRFDDEMATAKVRWGPTGQSQPATTRFSTKISR